MHDGSHDHQSPPTPGNNEGELDLILKDLDDFNPLSSSNHFTVRA